MYAMTLSRSQLVRRFALILGLFALVAYTQTFERNVRGLRTLEESGATVVELDVSNATFSEKPVMTTFYEPVPGGCCGMSETGHEKLLDAWETSWQDQGWDTRVLTEADARKHEDFELIEKKLQDLKINPYDRRCFWRWLAMASIGGWMSDYDLFPLSLTAKKGQEIANDDTFKSYALHVPCLIHASAEEWGRVLHLMIDSLPEDSEGEIVSDMMSLFAVRKSGKSGIIFSNRVAPTFPYTKTEDGRIIVNCEQAVTKLAAHFSHLATAESFRDGFYPKLDDVNDKRKALERRGEAAIMTMADIREQCASINVE